MAMDYDKLYAARFRDVDQRRREEAWGEIAPWIHRRLGSPARLLDPAAGTMEFLRHVPAAERWGVDLRRPDAPIEGIRFVAGDTLTVELPPSYFDAAFVSNFLEHLRSPEEVQAFLARMKAALRPGGVIGFMGPNFKYCADVYFDCADHRLALTHVSVEEHLEAAGFQIASTIPRFLPFSFRGGPPARAPLVRLYLASPWAWRIMGRQFLVLARRPQDASS